MKIEPKNKMAQILYRAEGNPSSSLPHTTISNCFPGLEYDFKQFWRRAFKGLVFLEYDNYVVEVEDSKYQGLLNHRLFRIDGRDVLVTVKGPVIAGGDDDSLPSQSNNVVMMEWSNLLALVHAKRGHTVRCQFSANVERAPLAIPSVPAQIIEVELFVQPMLDENLTPPLEILKPGELTQALCSPWQHDYRECACYYWPATRPDYVNVEPGPDGISHGDNWMAVNRSGEYVLDDRVDGRVLTYVDLFQAWEAKLKFQVKGRDAEES